MTERETVLETIVRGYMTCAFHTLFPTGAGDFTATMEMSCHHSVLLDALQG